MKRFNNSDSNQEKLLLPQPPIALFDAKQIYAFEQAWFNAGNASYGLMQQAAWLSARWIDKQGYQNGKQSSIMGGYTGEQAPKLSVCVWVGSGNNGGDGWLTATYLSQLGAAVTVIEVGETHSEDAKRAKKSTHDQDITHIAFANLITATATLTNHVDQSNQPDQPDQQQAAMLPWLVSEALLVADVFVDALFGIGLDRAPTGEYAEAIDCLNQYAQLTTQLTNTSSTKTVVAIDVPSGLVASTGQVFNGCAVKANVTLCLMARKLGLHLKDGSDYSGTIIDIPLIPSVLSQQPVAQLHESAFRIPRRAQNTHKGSFGHVLIVGGNRVAGSQGMGGAALLAASAAFAAGVGKVTVACHNAFHSSLIARLPPAMSLDLHDREGVEALIKACDVMAIGMGLGRDPASQALFYNYVQKAIVAGIDLVIDADGLYHLAHLNEKEDSQDSSHLDDYNKGDSIADALLKKSLVNHAQHHNVYYTPHSGEAAKLLNMSVADVEADKMAAVKKLQSDYQGSWLLKGTGSIVIEQEKHGEQKTTFVCASGNAGMATAGMGDVLSGLAAGLMAQAALPKKGRSLLQAVIIHAIAGDMLSHKIGQAVLQASDMPKEIGQVMHGITQ